MRTPTKEITFIISAWYEEEKRVANAHSISTAKLAQVVMQVAAAFGGSKEPIKTKVTEFLPYELDVEAAETEDRTRKILSKLIMSRRIPTHVIAALSPLISPGSAN